MTKRRKKKNAKTDKERGLYRKYKVERVDGSSEPGRKHEKCEYFVLDLTHDRFALHVLAAYIRACEDEYPALAADLRKKLWVPMPPGYDDGVVYHDTLEGVISHCLNTDS